MNFTSKIKVASVIVKRQFELQSTENGSNELGGIEGKFLAVILKALKVPHEFVFPSDEEWGRPLKDGNWTGMIGKVQQEEADMAINFIAPSAERMNVVDFSTPYSLIEVTFAIEKPGTVSPALAFLYPFPFALWIICGVILLLMPLVFLLLLDVKYSLVKLFIETFGSILRQPLSINDASFKNRILLSAWWFFAVIISFSYSALLLAFLTVPTAEEPIRNFKELSEAVAKGTHKCFVSKGSANIRMLLTSEAEYLRTLGEAIQYNDWYFISSEVIDSKYINPYAASIGPKPMLQLNFGSDMTSSIYLSLDSLTSTSLAIALGKNFRLKKKLNWIISQLNSAGIYNKILKDESLRLWLTRSNETSETLSVKPLEVKDMSGALILLVVGYGLSLIVFMCEIVFTRVKTKLTFRSHTIK
ncbi:glutamate receptor ionotropic, delta-2 [Nephila pilipes]|uniref:Glutamate receptor ionotropic, delta-2 n=1 Tax=Nephila pilipes TaxID=299642 RepID=A0A8X6UWR7_NEPPI|nr:glutamate receptor ionotropic, delta-2 [Nephila pilipes]